MKNKFEVGDKVNAVINEDLWLIGEIIDINNGTAKVAIPIRYGDVMDCITVESKLEDLREVK